MKAKTKKPELINASVYVPKTIIAKFDRAIAPDSRSTALRRFIYNTAKGASK